MEKNIEIGLLLETYGATLTDKQLDVMEQYYNDDLSLAEIAENVGITRQAVRDNIKNTEKKLYELESKLKILEKFNKSKEVLSNVMQMNDIGKIKEEVQKLIYNL